MLGWHLFGLIHELLIPQKYCIAGYFCGVIKKNFVVFALKKNLYAEIKILNVWHLFGLILELLTPQK